MHNLRLRMRIAYFRTASLPVRHVTNVTSGHVTSGHVTFGCSPSLPLK